MRSYATRREVIVGTTTLLSSTMLVPTSALALWPSPWWVAFSSAVAAGSLVEAIKNWGLNPDTKSKTDVENAHKQEVAPLKQQGYSVREVYRGPYSGGSFELSEANRGEDFLALGTTDHGPNICTLKFDKADAVALGLVSSALRQKGLGAKDAQDAALPLHPSQAARSVGNRRHSPSFMTPSHGSISWSTETGAVRPNLAASIRSRKVNANLRFACLDSGKWTFDMQVVG